MNNLVIKPPKIKIAIRYFFSFFHIFVFIIAPVFIGVIMRNKIHDSLDLMICDSLFFGLPVFFCLYRLYRLRKALITEFIFEQSFISLSSGEKIYYNDVGSVLSVGLVVVFTHGKAIKSYDSIFTNSQNELDFVIRKLDRFKINENAKHDL